MSYIAKNGRLYTSGASEALTLLDDKFSVNKSYSKGDSCIYNDYLWKFTSDKPAGEWDNSVVEQCRIMDFVDDINGRLTQLTHCDFGTSVDLENTSETKLFTFPNDGYIRLYSSSNSSAFVRIFGSSNSSDYAQINVNGTATTNDMNSIYVRKGMKCYYQRVTGTGNAKFIPLI